jgi:PAS domain S-box-containing protein
MDRAGGAGALAEEHAALRLMLEASASGIGLLGPDGALLEANRALRELAGADADEEACVGAVVGALGIDEAELARARGGERVVIERRPVRRWAQERWLKVRLEPADGGAVLVVADEVTAEVRAEHERLQLEASLVAQRRGAESAEQTLIALAETVPAAVLVVDRNGFVTLANSAAIALLGTGTGDLFGLSGTFTLHRLDGEPLAFEELPLARALESGEVTRGARLRMRSGSWETVLSAGSRPARDRDGQVIGAVTVLEDLAEAEAGERDREALLEQTLIAEARLQTVIEAASDGVVVYGAAGEITHMNRAAEQILGLSEAERRLPPWARIGLAYAHTPSGELFARGETPAARALRGEIVRAAPMVFARRTGKSFVQATAAPVVGPTGGLVGAVSVYCDLTARQELERQRESALQALANELKAPLVRLREWSRLVGPPCSSEELELLARNLQADAARADRLLESIIARARLDAGQLELNLASLDLRPFVQALGDRLAGQSSERVRIVVSPYRIPRVAADPRLLQEVLEDLVSRLGEWPESGELALAAAGSGDGARIFVARALSPMPDAELERALEVAAQSPQPAASSCLELEVASRLVEAQGGRLERLDSEAAAGFVLDLPAIEDLAPELEALVEAGGPWQD